MTQRHRPVFYFSKCSEYVRRARASLSHILYRALSLALILSLLSSSTLAAPQTTLAVAKEASINLALWFNSSGLARVLQGRAQKDRVQEKQSDRNARVVRLEIRPGDVTIGLNEQVTFAAVAYDQDDEPVGGVKIKWSARDTDRNRTAQISRHGVFEPNAPGAYRITADGVGKTAQVTVTVLSGQQKPRRNETPIRSNSVDTRSLPNESGSTNQTKQSTTGRAELLAKAGKVTRRSLPRRQRAHSTGKPMSPPVLDDGWGDSNWRSADDPGNTPGNPPGTPMDGGAGSGNFQFAAPVGEWPGRGTDVMLKLAYNSRLWNKANTQINYDIDRGWPGPGFSLGFSKLMGLGVYNGGMIIEADGTRHSFTGQVTEFSWGTTFVGKTTDGSFIDYTYTSGIGGPIVQAEAKLPNGTVITYGAPGPGAVYPTRIEDANGNYITITYVNNSGPRIQTIVDTLGRAIDFHYDSNNLLTAITAPALTSGTRTLVRLHYRQLSITPGNYSFNGLTVVVRDPNPWTIDAIYYPATNTGYWFGDTDSYSTYGMLAKVSERRNMIFSASSLNEQGTFTSAGQISREQIYSYPLNTSAPGGSNLTDAPTYTQLTENWTRDGVVTDQAVTTYEVHQETSPRTITITMPNGTKSIQHSHKHPGQFDDGLVFFDETRDASNAVLQSSTAEWGPGAYSSPRPNRITSTNDLSQTTATEFSYGASYNQLIEARTYDFGGTTLLRSTRTTYENGSNYINRHIFSLPLVVEVVDSNNIPVSRTVNQYDGQPLTAAPNVVQHNQASNPHAEAEGFCFWLPDWSDPDCNGSCIPELVGCDGFCPEVFHCPYNSFTDYRGNITQVTVYSDAASQTGAIIETRRYDVTGNMVKSSSACCEETTNGYTIDTQFAYQQSQTNGSATDAFKQITTSATYDFNTGLTLSTTDANGRQTQSSYFPESLRIQTASLPSGAHIDYAYDDTEMTLTETTYLQSHPTHTTIADQNIKVFDGRTQVRQEKALGAGGVFDIVDAEYDSMARLSRQSQPYRSGQTINWTTIAYDGLGRPTRVTAPDNSVTETYYNERDFDTTDGYTPVRPNVGSTAPGDTTLVRDAWGRERWGRTNAQGKLVEVVEPNPSGNGSTATGGLVTTYSYNTNNNLIGITQDSQTRSFKYDSLGRLTHQKLAEAAATLNDAGTYTTSGTWSDFFAYDDRSNLTSRTDARGVKAVYNYNDPLNRLQSVSFDTSGFGDTNYPIASAATITFAYRTKDTAQHLRDVTQLASVTTGTISTETYSYDTESRVSGRSVVINGRPSMDANYAYDALNRITDVTYPKRDLGIVGSPRKVVHHDYDVASRFSGLTVDGQSHASNSVYNAGSQITSLSVGASGPNQIIETYNYDPQTALLSNQKLARSSTPASPILDLSYDYAGENGKRTGQLRKILNNLNHNKDRSYTYDAIGRLTEAKGGPTGTLWTQTYAYDRYGNRTSVSATGVSAKASSLSNEQLALKNEVEVPDPLRTHIPRSLSDSSFNLGSRPTSANPASVPAAPQGPPVFTDDPLEPGVTIIKAVHITELRTAVNQARARAGLPAASWAETVSAGVTVKASHIVELRTQLDAARAALGLLPASYTDPSLAAGMTVKAVHVQELRQRVTEALASLPISADGHASLAYAPASNRITTAGFEYDAAGNQTRVVKVGGAVQKYQYDAANRLVTIKDVNNAVIATYTYGPDNQRLITEEGGFRTYYVVDGNYVIAEYQESGGSTTPTWFKSYVYLGTRLLSTFNVNGAGETVQYHHPDRLGTRLVTNAQDTNYFEQVTHPFGTAFNAESGSATNRRFTSYDRSNFTGLDYAVNRQYDPEQGRFTQADPLGMKATNLDNPQSLNMFTYCGNDPINRVDPDGLFSLKKFFKTLFKIIKLLVVAAIVALTVIAIVQLGAWLLINLVIALAIQNFILTVFNAIVDEIREHGFTLGSIFRGFGKGIARFFKAGLVIYYGNYCGPTNPNQSENRLPIDDLDAACQAHDRVYQATPEGTPDRNSRRLRADRRIFRRALGILFGAPLNPLRTIAAAAMVVLFGGYIIVRTLFLSDSPVPTVTNVSQNVGPRASFRQPTREVHRIKLSDYPELMNPAPVRSDRLRLGFGST